MKQQIKAPNMTVERDVVLGENSVIRGQQVILESGVRIGNNVEIVCDRVELKSGCIIQSDSTIQSPSIVCEEGCTLGSSMRIELNEHLHLGKYSTIGHHVTMTGQGVKSGEFLWMSDDVIVGGGGARGPRSFLTIGNRSSIFDKCYINLSEEVSIGSNTALSYNVVLLTHGAWQPALMGYPAQFGPIHIGNYVVIYLNSIVLPGVTIGDYSTVGAGSLVLQDIADHCLAVGNPARIRKGPTEYPRPLDSHQRDSLIRVVLADYLTTLESKGIQIVHNYLTTKNYVVVKYADRQVTIRYIADEAPLHAETESEITLSFGPANRVVSGSCHFDLNGETVTGHLTEIAEDLRDYLRRRAIRLFTDKPFRPLPLANLQRLQMLRTRERRR